MCNGSKLTPTYNNTMLSSVCMEGCKDLAEVSCLTWDIEVSWYCEQTMRRTRKRNNESKTLVWRYGGIRNIENVDLKTCSWIILIRQTKTFSCDHLMSVNSKSSKVCIIWSLFSIKHIILQSCLTCSWHTLYTFTALKKKKKITANISSVPQQMSHFPPCVRSSGDSGWMWLKLTVAGQLAQSGRCQGRSNSQSSLESGCSSSTLQEIYYYNQIFFFFKKRIFFACYSHGPTLSWTAMLQRARCSSPQRNQLVLVH